MDSTLLEAYRRTAFIAETPEGRLSLRVGQGCAELDALLAAHDVSTWAYVTAFNPGSVRLTLQGNSERQRQLERTVADLGFSSYPGEGIGDDGRWHQSQVSSSSGSTETMPGGSAGSPGSSRSSTAS